MLQDEVDRGELPRFFRNFAVIEAEVVSRFSFDPLLVPGLLQTEAYARAVFAGHCPPLSAEIIDQHTEARLKVGEAADPGAARGAVVHRE
ncbi:Transcriptional regulator with XRE-family HTH domain OS=Streptomyces albaduncus OX=68172 GN=FHS32_001713 PE=4 SV=1 [Streptomyces griseoloalbus]